MLIVRRHLGAPDKMKSPESSTSSTCSTVYLLSSPLTFPLMSRHTLEFTVRLYLAYFSSLSLVSFTDNIFYIFSDKFYIFLSFSLLVLLILLRF